MTEETPWPLLVAPCDHEPVDVLAAITGELVARLCVLCDVSAYMRAPGEPIVLPPTSRLPEPRLPDPGRCTHGRGICERCDPWNAGRPAPNPVPGVSDRR